MDQHLGPPGACGPFLTATRWFPHCGWLRNPLRHHLRNPGMSRFTLYNQQTMVFPKVSKWCRTSSIRSMLLSACFFHVVLVQLLLFCAYEYMCSVYIYIYIYTKELGTLHLENKDQDGLGNAVDGINTAPPKKEWHHDPPVNANDKVFNCGFKLVHDVVHPQLHRDIAMEGRSQHRLYMQPGVASNLQAKHLPKTTQEGACGSVPRFRTRTLQTRVLHLLKRNTK